MIRRALLTSCDSRFFVGAMAMFRSARRYHPDVQMYCIVPPSDLASANAYFEGIATPIVPPRAIEGVPERFQTGVARVFMTELPHDIVAYIDADALFCGPAEQLWCLEPGRVNAVQDASRVSLDNVPISIRAKFNEAHPLVNTKGFNAGVLSLCPKDWLGLAERFEAAWRNVGATHEDYANIMDQPLLNSIMHGRVNWMPYKYNAHNSFDTPIPSNVQIVHFTGGFKPWMEGFPKHEPTYYYWIKFGSPDYKLRDLITVRLRILVMSPKRLLGKTVRSAAKRVRDFFSHMNQNK